MELDGKEEAISMSERPRKPSLVQYFAKIIFPVREKSIFLFLVYSCSWPHLKSIQLTINYLNKLDRNTKLKNMANTSLIYKYYR